MQRSILRLVFLVLGMATAVHAQVAAPKDDPQLETVVVTAPKLNFAVTPNAISHVFIGSYAMPSVLLGTISRWQTAICPDSRGLPPQLNEAVSQRIRLIAAQVGAPVGEKGCRINLSITFTPEPQKLLDNIRAKDADALGYHGAVTITHPIQAWYSTGTVDIDGRVFKDVDVTFKLDTINPFLIPPKYTVNSPTPMPKVEGSIGRTGLKSKFLAVFVIVDTNQTGRYQVPSVADYAAMLALSQTQTYDTCQIVPSITNLVAPDCDDKLKPAEISASDIAYLKGVYKMDAGASLQVQRDQIAGEMVKSMPVK